MGHLKLVVLVALVVLMVGVQANPIGQKDGFITHTSTFLNTFLGDLSKYVHGLISTSADVASTAIYPLRSRDTEQKKNLVPDFDVKDKLDILT